MKPVSRIQINHHEYEGPRLHNDLSKLVTQSNDNFATQQTALDLHQKMFDAMDQTITSLLGRIAKLENAK